jgi:hypothetical protein
MPAGGSHVTVAEPVPAAVARTFFGFAGTPSPKSGAAGVIAAEGADGAVDPASVAATTVKVYAVPFASPLTIAVVCGAATVVVVTNVPAWYARTVYVYTVAPPPGAVHEIVALALSGSPVTLVGGGDVGVTGADVTGLESA